MSWIRLRGSCVGNGDRPLGRAGRSGRSSARGSRAESRETRPAPVPARADPRPLMKLTGTDAGVEGPASGVVLELEDPGAGAEVDRLVGPRLHAQDGAGVVQHDLLRNDVP